MLLRFIYTLFLGILLALFVGLGIAAFYEQPKPPTYPQYPTRVKYPPVDLEKDSTYAAELERLEKQNQTLSEQYQEKRGIYARNVSLIAIVSSIIILIISMVLVAKLQLISDGLLLGGVFTLMYSIIRGFESDNNKFRFFLVAVGLIIALFLGYLKFIKASGKR